MTSQLGDGVYDLLVLVDSTYSMLNYIEALQTSLPKVIAMSNLTNCFSKIGILAYRDYTEAGRSEHGLLEWSGWHEGDGGAPRPKRVSVAAQNLTSMATKLEPIGGGDYPEATKTGLARAYELMRKDATTIILLYTDAPPHCWMVADRDRGSNYYAEQSALRHPTSYSGFGHNFADWVSACKTLHEGEKKAHVFCFLDQFLGDRPLNGGYYTYLSTITRGACFTLTDSTPHSIAQLTIEVLLAWMGAGKAGVQNTMNAKLVRYKNGRNINKITTEQDELANTYFWAINKKPRGKNVLLNPKLFEAQQQQEQVVCLEDNLAKAWVTSNLLETNLPKRKTPIMDFAKRYAEDVAYKALVVKQLQNIIESDVSSMALNPVFGVLWRAVCNDRGNPAREKLITSFGLYVDRIVNADEKVRMKNWLDESYDYAGEITEFLDNIPDHQCFPCVFLDPTISFAPARTKEAHYDDEDDDEVSQPLSAFRRDELLEIGRSCDGRILRRLGTVLTRITYVESAAELPAHIAAMSNADVPKIPIASASPEYGWKFWRILLHIVLPGTMLAARPASVLAALATRIGLRPLFQPAWAAMLSCRDKWNDVDIPETWNSSCLGLLLDADTEYRKQMKLHDDRSSKEGLLLEKDRELFQRLVTYHHTGTNLLTTLTAEVGYTPHKTQAPIGPVVVCRGCKLPRSITIMAEHSGGRCGLCVTSTYDSVADRERALHTNVTPEDTASTNIAWVECSIKTCRAHYVCYNIADLNVRPKCWYCRMQTDLSQEKRSSDPAPTVGCTKCLSKVIWPDEWRHLVTRPFHCTACLNNMKTIVDVETNAEQLCKENGRDWLLQNTNDALAEPFKRSLFKTITTTGIECFLENVRVLPDLDPDTPLTLNGKQIRNIPTVTAILRSWTQRRTAERSNCSLCFNTFSKPRLLPACRRRGCHQSICAACLNNWYGLNSPGTIINTAALFCPFCRRAPTARTLAVYGKGIHAVGNLKAAHDERGAWVHAWCTHCNRAQRLMERECARGAPNALQDWKCADCDEAALAQARLAEEQAQRELERAVRLGEAGMAAQQRLRAARAERNRLECPVRECPACKVGVQKTYGCDHMKCHCGAHWCWACGEEGETAGDVYEHLSAVHGASIWPLANHLLRNMEDDHPLITDLITTDLANFDQSFTYHRHLGRGSDGTVIAYHHHRTSLLIAVKIPRLGRPWTASTIHCEARVLSLLASHGKHGNIAHMLSYWPEFGETLTPALFSMCAHFGDLLTYRAKWREQEFLARRHYGVKETGVWKLFRDLVLALEWLHGECGIVHRDVKSANVLVFRPLQWMGQGVPEMPVFKLCDFSRAVRWPAVGGKVHCWAGTVDYAPPLSERSNNQPATPAGDIWSLGATIQDFALGFSPIQSRKAVVALLDGAGLPHPKLTGEDALWAMPEWLNKFSAAYRPLNLSALTLELCFDVHKSISRSYVPFSDELQQWYKKLFEVRHTRRITSAELAAELVPLIDEYIAGETDKVEWKSSRTQFEASAHRADGPRSMVATRVDGARGPTNFEL
ncbi:dihydroxyacid dehydratase [Stagonosporopsis vannaccii]|nr:dihydroxyacid dehydratase [Stagonosporopsis vannaccii]